MRRQSFKWTVEALLTREDFLLFRRPAGVGALHLSPVLHDGPFDPVISTRAAAEFCTPPLCGPVLDRLAGMSEHDFAFESHLPEQASLFSLEPASVQLVGLRALPDKDEIELQLQEFAGQTTYFQLKFGLLPVARARPCDLAGNYSGETMLVTEGDSVSGQIGARRIPTLRLAFERQRSAAI